MTLEGGKYNTQVPKLSGNFVKWQSTSGLAPSYLYSVTVNRHDFSLVSMCQNNNFYVSGLLFIRRQMFMSQQYEHRVVSVY